MILIGERQKEIILFLCSLRKYVTIEQLSNRFNVSSRTIRSDVKQIKYFIKENKVGTLNKKTNKGIVLEINDEQILFLKNKLSNISNFIVTKDDRIKALILTLLIKNKTTYKELSLILDVTIQTLVSDFKDVLKILHNEGLQLSRRRGIGLELIGNELHIRKCFEKIVLELNLNNIIFELIFSKTELKNYLIQGNSLMEDMEKFNNNTFSEEKNIILILGFIIFRNNENYHIKDSNQIKLLHKYTNTEMCKHLVEKKTNLSLLNVQYVCKLSQSFRVSKQKSMNKVTAIESDEAKLIANYLINKLQVLQPINIKSKKDLILNLSLHLRSAIYRIKNNIHIKNEIIDQIRLNIPLIYEFTKSQLFKCERKYGIEFNEHEISYIAMYLASIYESSIKFEITTNILLVCAFGLTTSAILKSRIIQNIPDCNIFGPMSEDEAVNFVRNNKIDLIVATNNISIDGIRPILVNPLISYEDIDYINNELFQISYSNMCNKFIKSYEKISPEKRMVLRVKDIVSKDRIMILDEVKDWKEAIKVAAKPLLDSGCLLNSYVDRMIDAVVQYGTYMVLVPETAFVHAGTEDGINTDCTSILVLKKSIEFGERNIKNVKNIIILGIKNKGQNSLLNLIYIFENSKNREILNQDNLTVEIIENLKA